MKVKLCSKLLCDTMQVYMKIHDVIGSKEDFQLGSSPEGLLEAEIHIITH